MRLFKASVIVLPPFDRLMNKCLLLLQPWCAAAVFLINVPPHLRLTHIVKSVLNAVLLQMYIRYYCLLTYV